jgi:hypothetical protein
MPPNKVTSNELTKPTENAQAGVKKIEAVNLALGKRSMFNDS